MSEMPIQPLLHVREATKRYGEVRALDGVSLEIGDGEFLTLLGPSGSGKTTLLTAIAGFTELDAGSLTLGGTEITQMPPDKRDFGMVFQGYALFPTMTVAKNIAFPLKIRKWSRADIDRRVKECLALVQMEDYAERMPSQLSGGQQQRVALARALSFHPKVLLLDEPLSALDKKLRADLQWELKDLHRKIGVTFIYVTHDQEEALSMSDRIVILESGRIQQIGEPDELYAHPRTSFVADFLGKSNFFEVTVRGAGAGQVTCTAGEVEMQVQQRNGAAAPAAGRTARVALRPERVRLGPCGSERFSGTIRQHSYLGERSQVIVENEALGRVLVSCPTWKSQVELRQGQPISFGWDDDAPILLDDA
ncbi:ABC transporter ATP-binding protein [Paralimibaculum aggregatum]|uniref:Spermidine/putrescine import ATP-binding protein PotA n=1 Tax=Paralimibaculum aggregatum TaxID=3036245 RepID=A0ABQ6LGM7_9RHOB|nr:ABC transporter ATP-binding protein [Limibaculum sp. NKW23]GMG81566.1 ABC transporter ATP-binding protein [Limibaculum sp. NKW23]